MESLLKIYRIWLRRGPLFPETIPYLDDPQCMSLKYERPLRGESACFDLSRVVVAAIGVTLVCAAVCSAISDRIPVYRKQLPARERFVWVVNFTAVIGACVFTIRGVEALFLEKKIFGVQNDILSVRTVEFDYIVSMVVGYYISMFLLNAAALALGGSVRLYDCALRIFGVYIGLQTLQFRRCSYLSALLMILESPLFFKNMRHFVDTLQFDYVAMRLLSRLFGFLSMTLTTIITVWILYTLNPILDNQPAMTTCAFLLLILMYEIGILLLSFIGKTPEVSEEKKNL
eukprot:m.341240 g.341240  ORF g.341240 m.341240 type:complete len:287 (+) comp19944_c0_seq1:234-1094(+)